MEVVEDGSERYLEGRGTEFIYLLNVYLFGCILASLWHQAGSFAVAQGLSSGGVQAQCGCGAQAQWLLCACLVMVSGHVQFQFLIRGSNRVSCLARLIERQNLEAICLWKVTEG